MRARKVANDEGGTFSHPEPANTPVCRCEGKHLGAFITALRDAGDNDPRPDHSPPGG